jgi:hypothetical protein
MIYIIHMLLITVKSSEMLSGNLSGFKEFGCPCYRHKFDRPVYQKEYPGVKTGE